MGPFRTLLVALLKGTLLRGSKSPRVPLILIPIPILSSVFQDLPSFGISGCCLGFRVQGLGLKHQESHQAAVESF